jgi:hypothetical protein
MTTKIISLHNQSVRSQVVARPISRHEALRRVLAVARANGLGAGAVTEKNIAIVAELNLFGSFGTASNGEPNTIGRFTEPSNSDAALGRGQAAYRRGTTKQVIGYRGIPSKPKKHRPCR